MGYNVAAPNEYLEITGAGIDGVQIAKKGWVWPFQKVTTISVTPFDFSMNLQAMTIEKLKFSLPAVFTIGPANDDVVAITRYAILLTGNSDGSAPDTSGRNTRSVQTGRNHVQDIVKGIIEGETRSLVSTMTMEEVFRDRATFKKNVIENVQSEMDQFGLRIYNANVKELEDTADSQYFTYQGRKAHEAALNQAKIDVAEARTRGEIGECDQQSRSKQERAKIDAQTAILETKRKSEKATADAQLVNKEIEIERELTLERIAAKRAGEQRDAELQREVEIKRANMELERQRATVVVQARIQKESAQQKAEGDLFTQQKKADAVRYQQEADAAGRYAKQAKETDAGAYEIMKRADAELAAAKNKAESMFLAKKAEADGIAELARAYGQLGNALGGPQGLLQYLMIQDGTYEKLAHANAEAIQGLNPKISIWNNGAQTGGDAASNAIGNIFQNLPPLMSTIHEQTGMSPPGWLMQMPKEQQHGADAPIEQNQDAKREKMVNGDRH
ncbi:MAG: hypothetical protein M1828_007084 [Chrysothrix sp. TS-e1954]|nr:MAG: hypothetical protein M1828_007084 [Chrysothrix sp. TS-e1954]